MDVDAGISRVLGDLEDVFPSFPPNCERLDEPLGEAERRAPSCGILAPFKDLDGEQSTTPGRVLGARFERLHKEP